MSRFKAQCNCTGSNWQQPMAATPVGPETKIANIRLHANVAPLRSVRRGVGSFRTAGHGDAIWRKSHVLGDCGRVARAVGRSAFKRNYEPRGGRAIMPARFLLIPSSC